jgi:ankyrin repeat protein
MAQIRMPKTVSASHPSQVDLTTLSPKGETILHLATRLELKDIYSQVIDKTPLDVKDADGHTVLHHLAHNRNADMIAETLAHAPQLIGDRDNQGLTPMDTFMRNIPAPLWKTKEDPKDWTIIAEMLLAAKADPDSVDAKGRTLVYYAVIQKKYDFLEKALQMKVNPDIPDETGHCPLQYAIERKDMEAMDILLDRGANPDMTDARGWTVLDRLALAGDRSSPVVQRLIVAGGQYEKQLPLHREEMREPKPAPKATKPATAKTPRPR